MLIPYFGGGGELLPCWYPPTQSPSDKNSMKPLDLATIEFSGLNMIEASAGTGKTWSIAALYILLLLEKELRPEQILVVTYTKAATAELRERIRHRIATTLELYSSGRPPADDDLEQLLLSARRQNCERAKLLLTRALYSFDNAAIFTIHGFCQRVLLENSFESGSLFGSDMITDQSALVAQACDDFWRTHILTQPDYIVESLVHRGYTPEKLTKPFKGHLQNPDLKTIPIPADMQLQSLYIERDNLYDQVCGIWNSSRSNILQDLESAGLHQQSYKPAQILSAAICFDAWVLGGRAAVPNGKLDFFSADKIASKATKTSAFIPDHPFFSLCQQLTEIIRAIEHAFRNTIISCQQDFKQWIGRELSLRKKHLNQRSFDDLLLDLHLSLESGSGPALANKLRQNYKAALIDEFQDTDPIQWNIFSHLANSPDYPLFLIGDPKQAIYSFRGADVFAYLRAGKEVDSRNAHSLGTNYRSDAALVKAVSALFSASSDPFLCRDIPFHRVKAGRMKEDGVSIDGCRDQTPFKVWVYPRCDETKAELKPAATLRIVSAVAGEIANLLTPGRTVVTSAGQTRPIVPGDIAVLVKSHVQADHVQEALISLGIPSVQQGSATIFESFEALDLVRIMRAAAEPHRESLIREALLTTTMGLGANTISAYIERNGQDPEWEIWIRRFRNLHTVAQSGGIVALISRLLGSCEVRMRTLSRVGGERCITNIMHCCELLHQIEREQGKTLAGLITWLERKICSPGRDDAALLRLESDSNAVMISTIHASKGLQYPIVFVPFTWDAPSKKVDRALFHDDESNLVLDLAESDESIQRAMAERKAEAARLLYVALTRAEFRCYAVWGAIGGAVDSPLFQLVHDHSSHINTKNFSALSDRDILNDISTTFKDISTGISAELMPSYTHTDSSLNTAVHDTPYSCRTFGHILCDDWHIASFSGLTATSHSFDPRDHDILLNADHGMPETEQVTSGISIFDFPKGAKAGTCLHEIFERLEFSRLTSDAISSTARLTLADHGFHERWLPCITRMVSDVTSARIIAEEPEFSLAKLQTNDVQAEMEFYLPIKLLAPDTLKALFAGLYDEHHFGDFYEVINTLLFRQSRGMLQGFIDLVFTYNGRFYILDWKSNHLGMKSSDYGTGQMHESMCRSAYILQYHLYTLALDRLLKLRLPGYSYETHFGGAVYLYLRGVSADAEDNGVYRGKPSPEFIRRATELLLD